MRQDLASLFGILFVSPVPLTGLANRRAGRVGLNELYIVPSHGFLVALSSFLNQVVVDRRGPNIPNLTRDLGGCAAFMVWGLPRIHAITSTVFRWSERDRERESESHFGSSLPTIAFSP